MGPPDRRRAQTSAQKVPVQALYVRWSHLTQPKSAERGRYVQTDVLLVSLPRTSPERWPDSFQPGLEEASDGLPRVSCGQARIPGITRLTELARDASRVLPYTARRTMRPLSSTK